MTLTDDKKCKTFSMVRTLRKMFLNSPDNSRITLDGKCDCCERKMSIDIIPTSRGFGVLGGVLAELTQDQRYRLLCPVCHARSEQNQN